MACDLHCHSCYSFDGKPTLTEICSGAASRRVDIVATTDHCDMTLGPEGISSYLNNEAQRRSEYEALMKRGFGISELLYGIEVGNPIDMPVETEAFLRKREFDFVIGSIHFLPDGADIYKLPYASEEEVDAMFRQYFASMLDLARMGGFDSLAHLDYPLRVLRGKVREASVLQYRDLIEPILEETAHRQIALEINTRGTYDWQKRVGPEKWAVKRFRELGGKYVTIGSDAHTASLLGEGFDQAVALLSACGYDAYTIYRERKPVRIALRDDKEEMIAHVG